MRAALTLIAFAVAAAGCGYKGPLYLPKPKAEAQAAKPAAPAEPRPDDKKPGDGAEKE